ncbi:hypothetical protein CF65_02143 [Aggregatibacter actinomycetemcomitans HK1651]|nr:hypothetical protein ANH9381_1693 [Aggregatibacter actinomycetemcomitans ANH9381]AHN72335.1 hypothetical protein CF65_02143 [Aggregatibacter actinomycetemcomitans HK1651]
MAVGPSDEKNVCEIDRTFAFCKSAVVFPMFFTAPALPQTRYIK